MRKFHELSADDPVWTESAALTVGSVARAMSDSKTALAASRKLADRVDDVDEIIDGVRKSFEAVKAALNDRVAKLDAKIEKSSMSDAPSMADALAKRLDAFEKSFHRRQFEANGGAPDFETYMLRIEAHRESIRKRDEFDDGRDETSPARFRAQYRVLR